MRRYRRKTRRPFYRRRRTLFKRRYGRRRYSRMGRIRTRSAGFLTPDRLKVKLRVQGTMAIELNNDGIGSAVFIGNGPYDWDGAGTFNQQATGWDQWCAFYEFYYCSGSKIKLEAIVQSGTATQAGQVFGVYPHTLPISDTDLLTKSPLGYPYCSEKFMSLVNGPGGKATFSKYCSNKKIFGRRTAQDPNFQGTAGTQGSGTNPAETWHWNIYARSPNGAADSGLVIMCRVSITYYVQFYGRTELAIS